MRKRFFLLLTSILFIPGMAVACEVCNPGQAEFFRELTHGLSPRGIIDWILVAITAIIVMITFIYSLKFLLRPGEKNSDHIKRTILAFEHSDH